MKNKQNYMIGKILSVATLLAASFMGVSAQTLNNDEWKLVWHDEFDTDGQPDQSKWSYENGFVRNNEMQWYQANNAYCRDGLLIIEGRKEQHPNPWYVEGSTDWRNSRKTYDYTSASLITRGKFSFLYGRLEVRAKMPVGHGAWPAIWAKGIEMDWPSCGEIDIMECYPYQGEQRVLANAAWGTDERNVAKWSTTLTPLSHFTSKDACWADQYHVWRMDWDEDFIKIYLDDELLNSVSLDQTVNGKLGQGRNPFHQPQFLLLNLAMGATGGKIADELLPMRYEIDYVRVYQRH